MNRKILNEINEMKYLFRYKRGVVISEQTTSADNIVDLLNRASEWSSNHGNTQEQKFSDAIRMINTIDLYNAVSNKFKGGLAGLINSEFDVSDKDDLYWLNEMKNSLKPIGMIMSWDSGKVKLDYTAPPAPPVAPAAPAAKTAATVVDNWEDVKKYYKDSQDVDPQPAENDTETWETLTVTENGRTYILNSKDDYIYGKDNRWSRGSWSWDGTKPVFSLYKTAKEETTGYVNDSDTSWDVVTSEKKVVGLGASGPLVKNLQYELINDGYTDGLTITQDMEGCKEDEEKCDGIYGKETRAAVIKAQEALEIDNDGVVGYETYYALF
jgi:hypothetical protein